ncbi:hypothetical protein CDD83_2927 [Cordyceps sp. RAO-2017]|nr:hypothetical protein CDD83_2927 [Cordyceps sp. RAO-2017]
MAKPRLIIVIRHAQSEGNKNREIHQTIPDHRVKLTSEGWAQANEAGRRLRRLLRPDDTLQFFTSPYRRTRETTQGILATLTSDTPEPSSFRRSDIKVWEEPRLREQDFGNFQPCSAEMERMWQERADYGHFFYRIPNGESAADAYDRISGFNESLWRQFEEEDFASVCVLVTHGLMSRVFLMKWYHFTVEYFEDLRNIDHCEFLTMRKEDNGKYLLENKLRTWSELRRERVKAGTVDDTALDRARTVVVSRRWGGCPNGCNHTNHFNKRHDLEALRQRDIERSGKSVNGNGGGMSIASRRQRHHRVQRTSAPVVDGDGDEDRDRDRDRDREVDDAGDYDDDDDDDGDGDGGCEIDDGDYGNGAGRPDRVGDGGGAEPAQLTRARTVEDVISSPDGTPSFITASHRLRGFKLPHLHVGRDFGGSYSGHNSTAGSDSDGSEEEDPRLRRLALLNARLRAASGDDSADEESADGSGSGGGFANRLGDTPGSDIVWGMDDLDAAEKEDRSIRGSVY